MSIFYIEYLKTIQKQKKTETENKAKIVANELENLKKIQEEKIKNANLAIEKQKNAEKNLAGSVAKF